MRQHATDLLLPSIGYADALGLPFETYSEQQMNAVPPIDRLQDISGNDYFEDAKLGTWSDDTQQSLAVAESLTYCGKFDIKDIAERIAAELEISSVGWGKGSIEAISSYQNGADPNKGAKERDFEGGCGAIMRIAPLVWWHSHEDAAMRRRIPQIDSFTRLTHNNDTAVAVAQTHADLLRTLLHDGEGIPKNELLDNIARSAEFYESLNQVPNNISIRLQNLLAIYNQEGTIPNKAIFKQLENPESPFSGSDVLTMVYASFINDSQYFSGLDRLIHLGGDTDSSAAIFAAMSIAWHGEPNQWPPEDYDSVMAVDRLESSSRLFEQSLAKRSFEVSLID